jgi:hypothetical protein
MTVHGVISASTVMTALQPAGAVFEVGMTPIYNGP